MDNIIRQHYLNKIEKYFGKNTIIVLTGQRRVGKSYLLKQVRDQKQNEPNSNVIFIDKEKREFDSIQNYRDLNDYIERLYQKGKKNYLLIDEIQDIEEFTGKKIFLELFVKVDKDWRDNEAELKRFGYEA